MRSVPAEKVTTALGVYNLGIYLGAGIGFGLGGATVAEYGWRGIFKIFGGHTLPVTLWHQLEHARVSLVVQELSGPCVVRPRPMCSACRDRARHGSVGDAWCASH